MITLGNFRRETGFPSGDELELKLSRLAVIDLWEKITKRLWNVRTDHVEDIRVGSDYRQVQTLFLSLYPITSFTSVQERDADEDWETVDSDEYVQHGSHAIVRKNSANYRFWKAFVRVTYSGGVTEADEVIQLALVAQAKFMRARLSKTQITLQSQNFEGGAGVMLRADLHPIFKTLAMQHKRKV